MAQAIMLRAPRPFSWELRPPGSKSLTNRALLVAAMAEGLSNVRGWLDADDTRHMRRALGQLGVRITENEAAELVVQGASGRLPATTPPPALHAGSAGTVARFLLAVLAASPGEATLDGTPRMRERPMDLLIDGLRQLGARIEPLGVPGHLPLDVGPHPEPLPGGEVRLGRPASSQFVSGLLLAASLARGPTRIVLEQGTPARPYVDMTLEVLRAFGGSARWDGPDTLAVDPTPLRACPYTVEPDASAASYALALAAIYGGQTTIPDLGTDSLQGDVGFARVLERLGAHVEQGPSSTTVRGTGRLQGAEIDLSDMPDMTLTLAVTALFATGPTRVTGVGILRHHESDRLAAAAAELRKLGAQVAEEPEGLLVEPPPRGPLGGVEIETYDDHRMAMAFALAGEVTVLDPDCVGKTYPGYFNDLAKLGMVVGTR